MTSASEPRVVPLFIGPGNCVAAVGHDWRWLRDHADELGVKIIRIGSKPMIRASELMAAIERAAADVAPEHDTSPRRRVDPAAIGEWRAS